MGEMEKGSEDAKMAAVRKGRRAKENKSKQSNNRDNKQNQLTHPAEKPGDTDSSSSSHFKWGKTSKQLLRERTEVRKT